MQFLFGNTKQQNKVNFDDIRFLIKSHKTQQNSFLLISTLPDNEQNCLISTTVPCNEEVSIVNQCIEKAQNIKIVIYGKNTNDETVNKKYSQLIGLGFTSVYIYQGGLFEWLMLQDIYGDDEFTTTSKILDILAFRPLGIFTERNLMLKFS
tara:strand:+ start:466 stop:918 length:453 start_codon:yes stop_codon:yes gene_type:complete